MNADIALVLAQDGVVNGAIYALIALALVLVYAVTRIIWVPQGEFVAFAALSLASLELAVCPALCGCFCAAQQPLWQSSSSSPLGRARGPGP